MSSRTLRSPATCIFCFIAFCLTVNILPAAPFYLCQSTGSDANSGTSWAEAFETLGRVFEEVRATAEVDEIYIAEGAYPLMDLDTPPGTAFFGGFPTGGGPRDLDLYVSQIDIRAGSCESLRLTDGCILDGIDVLGGEGEYDTQDLPAVEIAGDNVAVRNCTIHGSRGGSSNPDFGIPAGDGIGIYVFGYSGIEISNNEIFDNNGGSPLATRPDDWGGAGIGIYSQGINVSIVDNYIHDNQGAIGISSYASAAGGDGCGISLGGSNYVISYVISGNHISGNNGGRSNSCYHEVLPGGWSWGIKIVSGRDILISDNRIDQQYGGDGGNSTGGWEGAGYGGWSTAISLQDGDRVDIRNNEIAEIHGGDGGDSSDPTQENPGSGGRALGIEFNGLSEDSSVFNNLIVGIQGGDEGVGLYWSTEPGSATGIQLSGTGNAVINNTLAEVHPGATGTGATDTGNALIVENLADSSIVNNIAFNYEDCGFAGDDPGAQLGFNQAYSSIGTPYCWGSVDPSNGSQDPLFVPGPLGDYYLSQVAAGQGLDSPCLDAGNGPAADIGLADRTTRTDEVADEGVVDQGYHYPQQATIA